MISIRHLGNQQVVVIIIFGFLGVVEIFAVLNEVSDALHTVHKPPLELVVQLILNDEVRNVSANTQHNYGHGQVD
ncbi:MAG: hypothetical protein U5J63_14345 [Fodinibius sp.]|nr:hypothetical protein [Fodinibius sp.]